MTLQESIQQLADEMLAAQEEQYGDPETWVQNLRMGPEPSPVCAFPSRYFDDTVVVSLPQGGVRQSAPRNCARQAGVDALFPLIKQIMPTAEVFEDWPQDIYWGGGNLPSKKVPYIAVTWSDGTERQANVGNQLEYFIHQYPAEKAFLAALAEFRTVMPAGGTSAPSA